MFQAAQKLGGYEVVSVYTICLKSSAAGKRTFSFGSETFLKKVWVYIFFFLFFLGLLCNMCLLDPGLDAELSQIQIWSLSVVIKSTSGKHM